MLAPLLLASSGSAFTVKNSDRIATPLQAAEFNSIVSRYMERPTSVFTEVLSGNVEVLMVRMMPYSRDPLAPTGYELRLGRKEVEGYIAAIEKFLDWSKLATERGDQFTKQIAEPPGWRKRSRIRFTFHAGNQREHYLVTTWVFLGTATEKQSHYYNKQNAEILLELLNSYRDGALKPTDVDGTYN